MLQLLNLKIIGIVFVVISSIATAAYFKGCSDGKDIGREEGIAEYKPKYEALRDAPPETTKTVTVVYRDRPSVRGTSAAKIDSAALKELLEQNADKDELIAELAAPKSTEIDLPGGRLYVHHFPLKTPQEQFSYLFEPEPERIETVERVVTRTAIEYRDKPVYEYATFWIFTGIAGVAGYAAAGGF